MSIDKKKLKKLLDTPYVSEKYKKKLEILLDTPDVSEQLKTKLRALFDQNVQDMPDSQVVLHDESCRFKRLVENNYDLISSFDSNRIISYVSSQISRFGYHSNEIIGQTLDKFVHPKDLLGVQNDFRMLLKTGESFPIIFRFNNKDDSYTHVELNSKAEFEDGKIVSFNATIRDVTERQLTEEALIEAEHKYRSMFEHIIDVYFRTNKSGLLTLISPSGVRLLGYDTALDILGLNFPNTCFEQPSMWKEILETLTKESRITNHEIRLKDKKGHEIIVEANLLVTYDKNARFVGIEGILRDISQKKISDLARQESEDRYRALVEQSFDAILIFQDEKTVFANKQALFLTGFAERQLYRKNLWELIHNEDRSVILNIARKKKSGARTSRTTFEARLVTADNSVKLLEFIIGDINYGGKPSMLAVTRDITDRKKMEEILRQSEVKYRSLVETTTVGIAVSRDHKIVFANQTLANMMGYKDGKEIEGLNLNTLVVPGLRKQIRETMKGFQPKASMLNFETELRTIDNRSCFVEITSSDIGILGEGFLQFSFIDITERKILESKMLEIENRNKAIIEASFDSIFIFDSNKILFANLKAEILTGFTMDELTGMSPMDIFISDEHRAISANIRGILTDDVDSEMFESKVIVKDKSERIVELTLTPILNNGNTHCLAHIRDITDRIESEETLLLCENRFDVLANMIPQGVFSIDKNGNITNVNSNCLKMFGISQDDFDKGLHVKDFITPEDLPELAKRVKQMMDGEVLGSITYTGIRRDGSRFPLLIYSFPAIENDEILGVRGIIVDDTLRQENIQELKLSQMRLELAIESANEALWDWDIVSGELIHNSIWKDLMGYDVNKYTFRDFETILHPDDKAEFLDVVSNHLQGRTDIFQVEHRARTSQGTWKILLTHGRVIEWDAEENPIRAIGTHVDLTEQKRMEEILIESEKSAVLGQLAGGVATELNNLMTSIEAYPDLILKNLESKEKVEKYISKLRETAKIGRNIVFDLIHLAHNETVNLYSLNINDILVEYFISKSFEDLVAEKPSVNIQFFPNPNLPNIQADQLHINRCIENLIKNALNSIKIDGSIEVRLGKIEEKSHEYVIVSVHDTGERINKTDIAHLFEPFYPRNKTRNAGGLRLALVKSIVEEHNGFVEAYSERHGNVIRLFLPK